MVISAIPIGQHQFKNTNNQILITNENKNTIDYKKEIKIILLIKSCFSGEENEQITSFDLYPFYRFFSIEYPIVSHPVSMKNYLKIKNIEPNIFGDKFPKYFPYFWNMYIKTEKEGEFKGYDEMEKILYRYYLKRTN